MIKHAVSISVEAYTRAIQWLNLGEPHPTLIGGALWYPPNDAAVRDRQILAEFAEQGLTTGNAVSDDFAETLVVMQRAAREYYTLAKVEGNHVTVRAAVIGRDAVLVIAGGGMVDLEPIPYDQLGIRVASALPETPAARIRSMSCDRTILEAIEKGERPPPGPSVTDARHMQRWLHLERTNVGEMHAAIRHEAHGKRIATKPPLSCWIDNETGRGLLVHADGGWLNLGPAGPNELAKRFAQLEDALRGR
ncbi:ESX secretion-associated protein EspG [Haloechinothrix salitolerans]|uniref:ESX secretion-associated protein EspG n=1 Tax=Haloechinothrix salitolerans TaxID=926830 RepID=A0ABW2BTT3_9PSEU